MQVGSADHHIHYFDLRKPQEPLFVFTGHKKAVSYVKFINETELASASTDSTLRLWDVKENCLVSWRSLPNKRKREVLRAEDESASTAELSFSPEGLSSEVAGRNFWNIRTFIFNIGWLCFFLLVGEHSLPLATTLNPLDRFRVHFCSYDICHFRSLGAGQRYYASSFRCEH